MAAGPQSDSPPQFFITRIAARAAQEGRPLTELETRYLEWNRIADEQEQQRLHAQIRETYGETGFEERMTDLLRQAFRSEAANDAEAPRRYRDNYARLDGEEKDLALWLIASPVMEPKSSAMIGFTLAIAGVVGLAFTLFTIILIFRYLFWK